MFFVINIKVLPKESIATLDFSVPVRSTEVKVATIENPLPKPAEV